MSAMKYLRAKVRNKFYLIIVLILSASFLNAQQSTDSKRIIRILSYNIFHGETMNHDFDLERIAGVIRSVSPDIVALQEVDFKTNRARRMDLVTRLGYLTNMFLLFGRAMEYDGVEYGKGILSPWQCNFHKPPLASPDLKTGEAEQHLLKKQKYYSSCHTRCQGLVAQLHAGEFRDCGDVFIFH